MKCKLNGKNVPFSTGNHLLIKCVFQCRIERFCFLNLIFLNLRSLKSVNCNFRTGKEGKATKHYETPAGTETISSLGSKKDLKLKKSASTGRTDSEVNKTVENKNFKTDWQITVSRCQSMAFIEDRGKMSPGILKAPSRCASADVVAGKEKKRLKVTFEDEVSYKLKKNRLL